MKTIHLEQGTEAWLNWRRTGIGATDIVALMGKSPWKTALEVYNDKSGFDHTEDINDMMQRGSLYESEARHKFEELSNLEFKPVCAVHPEMEIYLASLDGYNEKENKILEIKVPSRKVLDLVADYQIPEHYKLQVNWQLFVSGSKSCMFVAYSPETSELYWMEVFPDEKLIADMRKCADDFWYNTKRGIPPSPSDKDYIEIEDEELRVVCEGYKIVQKEVKTLETALKEFKKKIIEYGNDGNFKAYGIKATRCQSRATYDMQAMEDDGIPIEKYLKIPKEIGYYRLSVE